MKALLKNIMISVGLFGLVLVPGLSLSGTALADTKDAVCQGVNAASGETGTCDSTSSGSTVNKLVGDIVNLLSWVVGVVAVIAIIIGGFRFVTANGDASKVASARNTILYALVGLVIVATAQLIVKFVLGNVTT
jgi:hypothetical protein